MLDRKRYRERCWLVLFSALMVAWPVLPAEPGTGSVVRNGGFEEWEWAPIPPGLAKDLKPWKLKGKDINIDQRGPAYRRWTVHGVTGHMVEGADAYKGKSILINNDTTADDPWCCQIGLYAAFSDILKPGVEYAWEIALKGKGTFAFQAWVQGIEPLTGKRRWLGFPELIKTPVTGEWKVYQGTFRIPDYQDPDYRPLEKISCAIVIGPGNTIYLDEFSITPRGE